jgi:hypothetical protein
MIARMSLLFLMGCSEYTVTLSQLGDPVPGELGHGLFYWQCTLSSDRSCEDPNEGAAYFPDGAALGSKFELQYQADDSGLYLPVRSGSSHMTMGLAGEFTAVLPGFASGVVYRDDQVYDFLHLEIRPVVELRMTTEGMPSGDLSMDDTAQIMVHAVCDGGPCGGGLPYQWSVDQPDVLELTSPLGPDDEVRVRALSPGLATVTVVADTVGVIQIEVLGDTSIETEETGTEDTGIEDTGAEDTGVMA